MTAILIAIVGAVLSLGSLTSAVILNHHRNKVQEVRLISAEADSFHRTVAKVLDFDCSAPVSEKEERLCNSPSDRVTLLRESYLQRAAFLEQRLRPFESFVTVSEYRVLSDEEMNDYNYPKAHDYLIQAIKVIRTHDRGRPHSRSIHGALSYIRLLRLLGQFEITRPRPVSPRGDAYYIQAIALAQVSDFDLSTRMGLLARTHIQWGCSYVLASLRHARPDIPLKALREFSRGEAMVRVRRAISGMQSHHDNLVEKLLSGDDAVKRSVCRQIF
ncbi:MAG: hypothetical protein ACP5OS_08325 [Leptospirillia bacterium]